MRTSERETAEPSVTDGNKKKRSAPDSSASAASQARTESDGPPTKKKKKMEKKKKKPVEGHSEPIGDIEGRETAIEEGSSRDAAARAVVELNDFPIVLPKRKKPSRSHESSTKTPSAVASTFLRPSDGGMNFVVELYDLALKEATSKADSVACQKEGQKAHFMEKFGELKDKFEAAGAKIRGLEEEKNAWTREKAALEEKMVSTALRHLKEVNRLRDSRGYERCGEFETARSLQSQAFGTKKCLEALKESGTDIPHEMVDLFAEQEKEYEAEAKSLAVGGIPEELLCLSPLRLRSPFLDENVLAAIDPDESNAGLIDAGTAAFLQTPSSSQGDHMTERLDDPTGRELGESSFQECGIASEVVRPKDTTAPLVSDPAAFSAGLVVSEGPLIPTPGASGATPTPTLGVEETKVEPVNMLELSDSSTEEASGEKPDETEPILGGNPQGEERAVDEAENPPVLPTDETGGASDQLEAQSSEAFVDVISELVSLCGYLLFQTIKTAEPSVTDGNKKKRSAADSSTSIDAQARTGSDEPPRKKKKKEKKKRKKSIKGQSEPIEDAEGNEPVVHEGSSRDAATRAVVERATPSVAPPTATGGGSVSEERRIKFRDRVEFKYNGDNPLAYAPLECAELIRQIRGGAKDMPPVKDLLFKDAYVDAARTKSDGSMNYVVELYDTTLKETISKLKKTKKCLEALKESGIDIPQETIDLFTEQEKEFKAEAKRLIVGGIPEELLCLSPLHLPSTFLNEDVLATIDPYGSNTGLIDAGTAASLQTPSSSQGDHATERSNEPTGRELRESSVQGHEVVSRVERSEDATAPLVLDPAPSMANLVVSEESLIPILGVSDANLTPPLGVEEAGSEPVDLLELSDSSAEEEGGEKSDEQVPGDNPQGTEEGVVDEVENPPASTTDEAGGASD
ncbi:hypothetical protein DY000_02041225 [Brassica cretica]|uniref:Uncharacterized protein n=1 Tax=Brassica cretica TaxID=69181 RepID=A0ABQ7BB51_BRACR|nr:hypothetical protein DY000_02041225 [Brassica cretica]